MAILILTGSGATGKDYVAQQLQAKWGEAKVFVATSPTRQASLEYGIKTEAEGARLKGEDFQKFQFYLFDAYLHHLKSFLTESTRRANAKRLNILVRAPIDYAAYCRAVIDPLYMDTAGIRSRLIKGTNTLYKASGAVLMTPWPTPWYGSTRDEYRKTAQMKDSAWATEHAHLFFDLQREAKNQRGWTVAKFRSFDLDARLKQVENLFPSILCSDPEPDTAEHAEN